MAAKVTGEEQIIGVPRETEARRSSKELARALGITNFG